MAAFFLLKDAGNEKLKETALKTFDKRGIKKVNAFRLGDSLLYLYRKQLVPVENYYKTDIGEIFCVGTVVYKARSYSESLKALLSDYCMDSIDSDALIGSFVVLLFVHGRLAVLTDQSDGYKLFTDTENRFLTTSFLAAAACTAHTPDDDSVIEQVLYGYIGGPDTLVKEVKSLQKSWNIDWVERISVCPLKKPMAKRIDDAYHHDLLAQYMQDVRPLVEAYGAECGLSGGCDSRLIFAAVETKCGKMQSVHTHSTSKIHTKEIEVVKRVAKTEQIPLRIIPTTSLLEMDPSAVGTIVHENIMYYDARNSEAIGAFSETHTRSYKKKTTGDARVTFSGIGGEIYRNFYFTDAPVSNLKKWLESRAFLPFSDSIVPKEAYRRAITRIIEKTENRIGKRKGIWYRKPAKRYFDSYRVPNSLSNVIHANNQMSFYLAPFTEERFIEAAAADHHYQDHCGEYEGRIIARFHSKIAAIKTSKGYCISPLPKKQKIKWILRGLYPSFVWRARRDRMAPNTDAAVKLAELLQKNNYLKTAMTYFKKRYPDWNLSPVLEGKVPLNNFLFTVCSVYEISAL